MMPASQTGRHCATLAATFLATFVWSFAGLLIVASVAGCSTNPAGMTGGSTAQGSPYRAKGAREAQDAVAAGRLLLKEYPPLPSPPHHGKYVALLKERCGVEYEVPRLPPGMAEQDFIQEVGGWNEVMESAIQQKHGADIFSNLRDEAARG